MTEHISLVVNGSRRELDVEPRRMLVQVLRENLEEIQQLCQDALEDAVLMECDERQFKQVLTNLVQQLQNPYREKPE